MRLRCLLLLILLTLLPYSLYAQSEQPSEDTQVDKISAARSKGELQLAETLATQLKQTAEAESAPIMLADALFEQGRNAMERNQYDEAQQRLNDAISIYQDQGAQLQLGHAYRQLGMTYRYQANYSVALEYIYLAMQIYQNSGSQQDISNAHNSIGVVLEKMGQFEEAVQAHQDALEINYQLGDQAGIASALYNLGDIRRTMGDHDTALKYFQDALEIDQQTGNQKDIAYSHNKLASVYATLGNFALARVHVQQALALFRKIETPRDTDWALTILAEIEMQTGNLDVAEQLIAGVIQRALANNYLSLLVDAYRTAARIAILSENYKEALGYIEAGLSQASANEEQADQARFEELRVEAHLKNDSIQQAFDALQRQKRLEDQILNEKRLDAIAKLQAQSEFVRRAHQIELLEKEKSLQQAKLNEQRSNRNFWIAVTLACFGLLFLTYGRLNQTRTNMRLEREVELRTAELKDKNNQLSLAYKEMEAISVTDKLTGIHNRRYLEQHIRSDLDRCNRTYQDWKSNKGPKPDQQDTVVFIIDFDNFKLINDGYGHNVGDSVLIQLTERLCTVFRHSDYIVRWGGEEFVGVARFINRQDSAHLADRILQAVNQQPFELGDDVQGLQTCSIGFAAFPLHTETDAKTEWESLLSLADACLYKVKTSGKNGWMGVTEAHQPIDSDYVTQQQFNQMTEAGNLSIESSRVFDAG